MTLGLTVVAMIIGTAIGLVLAIARMSNDRLASSLAGLFIWFFRGTPLLVQLIFWYNLSTLFPEISLCDSVRPDAGQLEHQRHHHADDRGNRRSCRSTRRPTWPRLSAAACFPSTRARSKRPTPSA